MPLLRRQLCKRLLQLEKLRAISLAHGRGRILPFLLRQGAQCLVKFSPRMCPAAHHTDVPPAACGIPGIRPRAAILRSLSEKPPHAPLFGWAGTRTVQWTVSRSRWCGTATCRTCWWRNVPVPSAPARSSRRRAAPAPYKAARAAYRRPAAAISPRCSAASWPWPAGTALVPDG